jgi:hypothetical protein
MDDIAKAAEMVRNIRKRLDKLNIKYVTIGQFKGKLHIYLINKEDSKNIIPYLLDDEEEIITFHKA